MPVCKNCSHVFDNSYCNRCGQKDTNGRFTAKELVGDFITQVFTLELPLLHTVQQLFSRPGRFCEEYIRGKRRPYLAPIQFFILLSGVHILVRVLTKFDPIANQYKAQGIRVPTDKLAQRGQSIGHFISDNLSNFFFLLVFIFAFFSWLLFRKSRFTYTENVVFGFYVTAAYTIFPSLAIFLSYIHPRLYYFLYFAALAYFTWALIDFHRSRSVTGLFKGIFASALSYFIYVISAVLIGMVYIRWMR